MHFGFPIESHLRPPARWSRLALWLFPAGVALIVNGGLSKIESRASVFWFAAACFLVAGFTYLLGVSERFQRWALKPGADVEQFEGILLWTIFGYSAFALVLTLMALFWSGPGESTA